MSQPNPLELAKQGHPKAIESLINRQMQPKGITAKVALKNNCLHIMLEAAQPPDQKALVPVIRKGITNLGIPSIEILKIYGKQVGEQVPAWSQEFELVASIKPSIPPQEVDVKTQPSVPRLESKQSENIVTKRNINSKHPEQNSSIKPKKPTIEEKIANYLFAVLLGLSVLLLFINWLWAILVFCVACLVSTRTPAGKAATANQNLQPKQLPGSSTTLTSNNLTQRAKYSTEIDKKSLLDPDEQVLFYQAATYRGGVRGYPNSAQSSGFAFVLDHYFVFYDKDISFKISYEKVIDAQLDFFQLGGVRGMLALGDVGRQLQQTKNILDLRYIDEEDTERSAKFQINGALTIPGEAEKAAEFLNHLLEFKGQFTGKAATNKSDPVSKLEQLKKLKDQGIINESEFEAKKRELLDQM